MLPLTTAEHMSFNNARRVYIKIVHTLGQKAHLNDFKTTEIVKNVFSGHNGTQLKIDNRSVLGKHPNTWKLTNALG